MSQNNLPVKSISHHSRKLVEEDEELQTEMSFDEKESDNVTSEVYDADDGEEGDVISEDEGNDSQEVISEDRRERIYDVLKIIAFFVGFGFFLACVILVSCERPDPRG